VSAAAAGRTGNRTWGARVSEGLFRVPRLALAAIGAATLFFAAQLPNLSLHASFADLLPAHHPYIELHNRIRETFGGANVILVALEAEDGSVLTPDGLARLDRLTRRLDQVPGVNHNLLRSLTHRNVRNTRVTPDGNLVSRPYYNARAPAPDAQELAELRRQIEADPAVFGVLVSTDLSTALIQAQLNESGLDIPETFAALQRIRSEEAAPGISIHAVGPSVLAGWAFLYLPEAGQVALWTVIIMLLLLWGHFYHPVGVFLPLLAALTSAIWGLGYVGLRGEAIDPLTLVVPFLVSARALSHAVQMLERFREEWPRFGNSLDAARASFESLLTPGLLAIVGDAAGIWLISLSDIPLNDKLAGYGSFWALSISVSGLLLVPLLLAHVRPPGGGRIASVLRWGIPRWSAFLTRPAIAKRLLWGCAALFGVSLWLSMGLSLGETRPGSSLLYADHDYNRSAAAIADKFAGTAPLYLIARTREAGGVRNLEVLEALESLTEEMENDPAVVASYGLPQLVRTLHRFNRNGDPRYAQLPEAAEATGGLIYSYLLTAAIPDALRHLLDSPHRESNAIFYARDYRAETVQRLVERAQAWAESPAADVDGLELQLAGGVVGVTAAINQEIRASNWRILPAVLGFVFLSVLLFYRSFHAAWLMLMTMLLATVLTHAYLRIAGIAMNLNTISVVGVGIGIGIDYAIYLMDRIRWESQVEGRDLGSAVRSALGTTGLAITFTAITLVCGVAAWVFGSTLRFQADAAQLLIAMMIFNLLAALLFVPAWVIAWQPRFLAAGKERPE